MKKTTAFLMALIILLTGILLTSCQRNEQVNPTLNHVEENTEIQSNVSFDSPDISEPILEETNEAKEENNDVNDTIIPSFRVSNPNTKLPVFSVETVIEDYLNLVENGFFITCQQEQDVLEYTAKIYNAYFPRLFIEDGNYVLVYLNDSDGFLYKNDQQLEIHCTDLIDINSLINLAGMDSSEIILLYEKSKEEYSESTTEVDSMAREFILRKVSEETGYSSLDYPRFFRRDSEVVVLFEKDGIMKCVDISPIRP